MKWEEELSRWYGSQIEVHIEDLAGLDPVAPPKKMTLEKVFLTEDYKHLQIYFNATQFLAIPIQDEQMTQLIDSEQGTILRSSDPSAQLVYTVTFQ